jgi:hypothetical protein
MWFKYACCVLVAVSVWVVTGILREKRKKEEGEDGFRTGE